MDKYVKLEQLQKLKDNGGITQEEFETEKEKILKAGNTNKTNQVLIILTICLAIIIAFIIVYFLIINPKNNNITTTNNASAKKEEVIVKKEETKEKNKNKETVSFSNMNSRDKQYSEIQQLIIDYFDYDYFGFGSKSLQRYPQLFTNAKVQGYGIVMKVIESNDESFKVVVAEGGEPLFSEDGTPKFEDRGLKDKKVSDANENLLFVVQGKQLDERLLKGDLINVYGRYEKTETIEIDGITYTLPIINSITTYKNRARFTEKELKSIAEYVFGKDVKFSKWYTGQGFTKYKITLDNQSNGNFKTFVMTDDGGPISYYYDDDDRNITKKLWIGADFEHYIVTTYDQELKHAYLESFDKSLNKIWSREFDFKDNSVYDGAIDFTKSKIAVVIDNDLYIIDANTGENLTEPVLVGQKIKVSIVDDGIILVGNSNKDIVMKVSFDGKILARNDYDSNITTIHGASTQLVEGKMVISIAGTILEETPSSRTYKIVMKYVIVNEDGSIQNVSTDMLASDIFEPDEV